MVTRLRFLVLVVLSMVAVLFIFIGDENEELTFWFRKRQNSITVRSRRLTGESDVDYKEELAVELAQIVKVHDREVAAISVNKLEPVGNWEEEEKLKSEWIFQQKLQVDKINVTAKDPIFCAAGNNKCLPNVWFIGASKCGTTTMAKLLTNHPKMKFVNSGSEAHIFDYPDLNEFRMAVALNALHAPSAALNAGGKDAQDYTIVEYTPHYLYEPIVAYRIFRTVGPEVAAKMKFLVMLREPVARAFSSWVMKTVIGNDKRTFHQSVKDGVNHWSVRRNCIEEQFAKGEISEQVLYTEKCRPAMKWAQPMWAHVEKSIYSRQLDIWFSLFPEENFFFLQLEDFHNNSTFWFMQVVNFMGLEAVGPQGFESEQAIQDLIDSQGDKNTAQAEKTVQEYDGDVLRAFYRPYNYELDELLGWETGYSV